MADATTRTSPALRARPATAGRLAAITGTAVALGIAGYFAMFSLYSDYDDEGYCIYMFRELAARGGLYDRVFSQYGPFYMLSFGLPARLFGFDWTWTSARFTALALWIACTALAGLILMMLCRRFLVVLLGEAAVFFLLEPLTWEPMHPGTPSTLLILGLVACGVAMRRRPRTAGAAIGIIVAALALTKINIGIFMAVAVAFATIASSWTRGPVQRKLRLILDVALVALGPALILSYGYAPWKATFACVYVTAAVALIYTSRAWDRNDSGKGGRTGGASPVASPVAMATGAAAAGALVLMVALATGSSPGGLIDGILLRPTAHGRYANVPVDISTIWVFWLLAIPATRKGLERLASTKGGARFRRKVAAFRILGGLILLAGATGSLPAHGIAFLPLSVLALMPPPKGSSNEITNRASGDLFAHRLLVAVAVLSTLQVFPVAGAQVAPGLVGALLCALVAVDQGMAEWLSAREQSIGRPIAAATLALAVLLCALVAVPAGRLTYTWITRYQAGEDVSLNGADRVRLDPTEVTDLRWIASTLHDNCAELVTVPGIESFYMLARIEPPTGYNAPGPMMLKGPEQQAIIDKLDASEGPVCALTHPGPFPSTARLAIDVETNELSPVDTPKLLENYVKQPGWRLLGERRGYEVWVRG